MTSEEIVREIDEASLTILRLTSEVVRLRERLAAIHNLMTKQHPERPAEVQFGVLIEIMEQVVELSKPEPPK